MWQNWIVAILGLWVMLSSFMGMSASSMSVNLLVIGAVIAVLGFWSAYIASRQYDEMRNRQIHA